LISPVVGAAGWAATATAMTYSLRKLHKEDILEDKKIPLMGIAGAFVFAAQMINIAIPGTGISGHLCGGLLLACLLGPYAGFITISVILAIQALFFGDGGLFALGCNIFNMGVLPCFIAYPLLFKPIAGSFTKKRLTAASLVAGLASILLAAFAVAIEIILSNITALPWQAFLGLMLSTHFIIGIGEGLATGGILLFIHAAMPEIFAQPIATPVPKTKKWRKITITAVIIVIIGVGFWFNSAHPDGLEWSLAQTGVEGEALSLFSQFFTAIQQKTSIMPDYNFKNSEAQELVGNSFAGIVGSGIVIMAILLICGGLYIVRKRR